MTTLDKMEQCAKESSKRIVESGDTHNPIMLVDTPMGLCVVGIGGLKDKFRTSIPPLLRKMRATGYVLIVEAWTTITPVGSDNARKILGGEMEVHELPPDDRDEAIIIISVEKGNRGKVMTAIIDNTPNGRKLRQFRDLPGASRSMGRMAIEDW